MQHLLTEEELTALVPRTEYEALEEALKWCFELLQPPGCPHLSDALNDSYCDGCPLESQDMGSFRDDPNTVNLPPHKISRLICKLERFYGK